MLLPATSAARQGSEADAAASASRSFRFTYGDKPPLQNVVQKTLKGDKTKDGNCIWHPADMTLPAHARAMEQRQISADYANCTTVVEIGTPTQIDPIAEDEELAASTATTSTFASSSGKRRTLAGAAAYFTSRAYYKVTWYDFANLR